MKVLLLGASLALLALTISGCGSGGDPAPGPTPGPSPGSNLPFGEINVMIVTDTHSWIAGHKHETQFDANYGDVVSLYERTKDECDRNGKDLFFVMNGDINDGTGISTDPPIELVPLLQKMPWDAVTVGNHELYKNEFISYLTKADGFINHWGDRYLTANVVNATTGKPLGRTHKFLKGQHGTTLLTLGFLYEMPDHATAVKVLKVKDVVRQQWFLDLLSGKEGGFDAVMVLGHMDAYDPLVSVLLQAIREIQPRVPVQFVTGHSHQRKYTAMDVAASSFEAGNYLNTVGFASFPKNGSSVNASSGLAQGFQHVFIDASVKSFAQVVGTTEFSTEAGRALTLAIKETRQQMGLSHRLGCSPMTYSPLVALDAKDSLWNLFMQGVIVDSLFHGDASKVFMVGTGSARYNLYEGNVTKDDIVTMMPFADEFWSVGRNVSGAMIAAVLAKLNEGNTDAAPTFVSTPFDEAGTYELLSGTFDTGTSEKPGDFLEAFMSLTKATIMPEQRFVGHTTTKLWYDWVPSAWPCNQLNVII